MRSVQTIRTSYAGVSLLLSDRTASGVKKRVSVPLSEAWCFSFHQGQCLRFECTGLDRDGVSMETWLEQ